MPLILTAATIIGWLALWAVLAVRASRARASAGGARPPRPAGVEPPAVVSLLAGRLEYSGYPATLLDLAARGWFRLEGRAGGGPVLCVLRKDRPSGELTPYERQVYEQLVARAGDRDDVPAGALSDGFAGAAAPAAASDGSAKSPKDAFLEAFTREVKEDARGRGLTSRKLSEPAGCLLWVAALVPAGASALAVHAGGSRAYWLPVVVFFALCVVSGVAHIREKPTPAGRAVLRSWRARCKEPAGPAYAGTHAGRGATVEAAVPPGWPRREVAYAAALGLAPTAVKLFSDSRGSPPGKVIWSSHSGHWRRITIGDPLPRSWFQAGGLGLGMLCLVLLALLPATLATFLLAHGELRVAAVGVMAGDAVLVARLLAKDAAIPGFAEFDGRVVEAWTQEESGEDTSTTHLCLAIDDGVQNPAWAFSVSAEQYRQFTPGTLVHARVNPRRNRLLDITSLAPTADRRGLADPTP
jgi:hypothetical protein